MRPIALSVVLLTALVFFAHFTNHSYPIEKWLFWRYAGTDRVRGLRSRPARDRPPRRQKVLGRALPFREHLGASFTAGVFVFYFVISLAGLFHLYGCAPLLRLPAAMLAAGGLSLFRSPALCPRRRPPPPPEAGAASLGVRLFAFGLLGLGVVYFDILSPENVQFDPRWKHPPSPRSTSRPAASGASPRDGRSRRTRTSRPTSTLWGFLLPFGRLFDRVALAAHLEFTIFVATTLMIPALVRRLVPGTSGRSRGPRASSSPASSCTTRA